MAEKPRKHKGATSRKITGAYPSTEVKRVRSDRQIAPPVDATPADPGIHLRWVNNTQKRTSDMKRRSGYESATAADVMEGHGGYVDKDGSIVKGDLILMKTDRSEIENAERKRQAELTGMKAGMARQDRHSALEEAPGHRPGRTFQIPIDLNK